ncbi:hypothetical protein LSM04_008464 [Trypanosoma melophagium]|nr:hypothetical protein LSM04_008464 [Trypanosoma melophagium]
MSCDHEDTWRLKGGQSPPDDLDGDSIECLFLKNSKKTSSSFRIGEDRKGHGEKKRRSQTHPRFGVAPLVRESRDRGEAFSREPPCDGVGALAVRQTPETRGTAWEFLSYYPILPSRYLRDPFTISH